jgi:vacuolar-type H+-ATPase subunit I/STV1
MTQEQLNVLLAVWAVAAPIITLVVQKYFSKNRDNADYGSDLLNMLNQATESLKKSREEKTATEEQYEKTLTAVRQEHSAAIASVRSEYDGRIDRLKSRVLELENVQRIYEIKFDLVTHPNVEVKNVSAKAMDDVTASQKMKAITNEQIKSSKE